MSKSAIVCGQANLTLENGTELSGIAAWNDLLDLFVLLGVLLSHIDPNSNEIKFENSWKVVSFLDKVIYLIPQLGNYLESPGKSFWKRKGFFKCVWADF